MVENREFSLVGFRLPGLLSESGISSTDVCVRARSWGMGGGGSGLRASGDANAPATRKAT